MIVPRWLKALMLVIDIRATHPDASADPSGARLVA
jgi:hypothetical protein